MSKTIGAYTENLSQVELGEYVAYINIARLPNGNVQVIVRQRGTFRAPEAQIEIPADEARKLFHGA